MTELLRLGDFVLDLDAGELRTSADDLAPLRRQALDVLLVLGRRAGQDSIRAWHGFAFMSLHSALNGWASDRAAAMKRVDVAAAELDRIDREGHYTYNAKTIQFFVRGETAAMLRHTRAWIERHPVQLAFGAHGFALMFNGHFDDAVRAQERALRLSPRDPIRAEWQYRLAMAHFAARRYELARDWAQTAATTNPGLRWPPIHAAALWRLGQREAACQTFVEHESRHGRFDAAQAMPRLPGTEPRWVEARQSMLASLHELSRP